MDHEPVVVDARFTEHFAARLKTYPPKNRRKIIAFMLHLRQHGFDALEGRNKYSDDVSTDDPEFLNKIIFIREHCLWHYHVGIHEYKDESVFGDRTSMFVLHYSRLEVDLVRIAHLSPHPPFTLPTVEMFT